MKKRDNDSEEKRRHVQCEGSLEAAAAGQADEPPSSGMANGGSETPAVAG